MKSITLYISVLAMILSSCSEKADQQVVDQDSDSKLQTVEVVNPEMRSLSRSLEIAGNAFANQSVELYSMEAGMVKRVYKDIGDRVVRGETLIELRNPELYRIQAEKRAMYQSKKDTYDRLQASASQTPALVPEQLLDEAKGEATMAEAALGGINDRISFLRITAPFSGVITDRYVDEGALVQNGILQSSAQGVMKLLELDPIRFKIPVPESEVSSIHKADSVTITFPELDDLKFKASISRISYALDAKSKSMMIEVDIPNKQGIIRPGMYGQAEFAILSNVELMVVPATARIVKGKGEFIMLVTDGKVKQVSVKGAKSNKNFIEVRHPDITMDSKIIVQGKNLVKDGEAVTAIMKRK